MSANPSKHKVTEARVLSYQDDKPNVLDIKHAKLVAEGLEMLETEERLKLEDGEITLEDAQKVASSVENKHAVFSSVVAKVAGNAIEYDWVGSGGAHTGAKKKSSSPPKLEAGNLIKIDGYGQRLFEVKTLNSTTNNFSYAEVELDLGDEGSLPIVLEKAGGSSGTSTLDKYNKPGGWKKYNPETQFISKATLTLWNQKDEWSEYSNARIVLNYRQTEHQRNKPGYQWHHIH